jgi:hypothetical protein
VISCVSESSASVEGEWGGVEVSEDDGGEPNRDIGWEVIVVLMGMLGEGDVECSSRANANQVKLWES